VGQGTDPRGTDLNGDGVYEVAALVGSLRQGSYNRGLLRAAQELKPAAMRLFEVPIGGLPLFNEDLERDGDQPAVRELKAAILAADAVLVITPEYNQSVPGVLKNALDWGSRRYGTASVLKGKPVAMMGASNGRFGTARSQLHLRQIFPALGMRLLPQPEVYLPNAADAFDAAGVLTDERARRQIEKLMGSLLDWTERVGGGI